MKVTVATVLVLQLAVVLVVVVLSPTSVITISSTGVDSVTCCCCWMGWGTGLVTSGSSRGISRHLCQLGFGEVFSRCTFSFKVDTAAVASKLCKTYRSFWCATARA